MGKAKNSSVKKNKGRRNNTRVVSPTSQLMRACVRAVVFSISAAFIFMLLGAAISFKSDDPTALIHPISISALLISASICGFLGAKFSQRGVLIDGSVCAFLFSMTILLISFFIKGGSSMLSAGTRAVIFLLTIPAVYAGAILGAYKKPKKRKNPYSHKR